MKYYVIYFTEIAKNAVLGEVEYCQMDLLPMTGEDLERSSPEEIAMSYLESIRPTLEGYPLEDKEVLWFNPTMGVFTTPQLEEITEEEYNVLLDWV